MSSQARSNIEKTVLTAALAIIMTLGWRTLSKVDAQGDKLTAVAAVQGEMKDDITRLGDQYEQADEIMRSLNDRTAIIETNHDEFRREVDRLNAEMQRIRERMQGGGE